MAELTTARFVTKGMHCNSCAMLIQMTLGDLEGVTESTADAAAGVTTVVYDPAVVGVDAIVQEIRAAGYDAEPPAA